MTFAKGDHARALTLYQDALASFETVGDHPEIARVRCEMGWTALADADTERGHAYAGGGAGDDCAVSGGAGGVSLCRDYSSSTRTPPPGLSRIISVRLPPLASGIVTFTGALAQPDASAGACQIRTSHVPGVL